MSVTFSDIDLCPYSQTALCQAFKPFTEVCSYKRWNSIKPGKIWLEIVICVMKGSLIKKAH